MTLDSLSALISQYGYLVVFLTVLLASAGVPLPAGELLIAAAAYAAHTHRLDVALLGIGAAAMSSIGGAVGYGIGRSLGSTPLERHGKAIGLTPQRLRLGQYLFLVHGGKIVFLLRFVALLSPFGGLLAGVNKMPWVRFVLVNAFGAASWAAALVTGGFAFGAFFVSVGRPIGLAALAAAVAVAAVAIIYLHRQGANLQMRADAMASTEPPD